MAKVVDSNGKYGFVDKTGELVIPCIWESAYDFKDGRAKVYNDQYKEMYIDKTGRIIK